MLQKTSIKIVHPKIVHGTINGYSNYKCRCDKCRKWNTIYRRKQYLDNKDKWVGWSIAYLYGITLEDWNNILLSQGGGCAVCGVIPTPDSRRFHTDHNHITGEVRGILCGNCNMALGLLKDDESIINGLLKYIKEIKK